MLKCKDKILVTFRFV